MYRYIVASKVRAAWRQLDEGNAAAVLDQLAPDFDYHFVGDHALGGTRRTRAAMAAWFERLARLFPGVRFTVDDVLVRGWPWATRVVVLVTVDAPAADGGHYRNELAQTLDCAGVASPASAPSKTPRSWPPRWRNGLRPVSPKPSPHPSPTPRPRSPSASASASDANPTGRRRLPLRPGHGRRQGSTAM